MSAPTTGSTPRRPSRRATDGGARDQPHQRQRRLLKHITGDPALVDWLAQHDARVLERAAHHLDLAGHPAAAQAIRHVASGYRDGHCSPL